MKKQVPQTNKKTGRPLSLYPMSPEEALSGFMKADPKVVDDRMKKQGIKKEKKS